MFIEANKEQNSKDYFVYNIKKKEKSSQPLEFKKTN